MKAYTKRTIAYWLAWITYYLTFSILFVETGLVANAWAFVAVFFLGSAWVYIDQRFDRWREKGQRLDDESR